MDRSPSVVHTSLIETKAIQSTTKRCICPVLWVICSDRSQIEVHSDAICSSAAQQQAHQVSGHSSAWPHLNLSPLSNPEHLLLHCPSYQPGHPEQTV